MFRLHTLKYGTAALTALTLFTGTVAPIAMVMQQAPAQAQAANSFSDVASNYWAKGFIQGLVDRGVITGFPDGSYRPNEPVTRAQFAAMVGQAFNRPTVRSAVNFADVPSDYWASPAIRQAYAMGFVSGFPENEFRPGENISRAQVMVALASGLGYSPNNSVSSTLQGYNDARSIPDWARNGIAATTEKRMVVNYPNVAVLDPNRAATRAEVAALIYQSLVSTGSVAAISSPYIAAQGPVQVPTGRAIQIPAGTTIPTRYDQAEKIYLSFEEPNPVPVTLTIDRNIVSPSGQVLIPADSRVEGELRVSNGRGEKGAKFHAKDLLLADNTRLPINATSDMITTTEEVRRNSNAFELLAGAAVGAGAAAAVAAVTGDRAVATEEVLGGGALGVLAQLFLGRNRVTLISIDPNTDLDLALSSPLALR
jgi:hypothetical protein